VLIVLNNTGNQITDCEDHYGYNWGVEQLLIVKIIMNIIENMIFTGIQHFLVD
jgi:hypothetical protein